MLPRVSLDLSFKDERGNISSACAGSFFRLYSFERSSFFPTVTPLRCLKSDGSIDCNIKHV